MSATANNNNNVENSAFARMYFHEIDNAANVEFRSTESPISRMPFEDPVVDGCGHTYDRRDIPTLILNPNASEEEQIYRCHFSHQFFKVRGGFVPNRALRDLAEEIHQGDFKKIVKKIAEKEIKNLAPKLAKKLADRHIEKKNQELETKFARYKEDGFFQSLVDPDTGKYMKDPVVDIHGCTLDRSRLEEWKIVSTESDEPMILCPLTHEIVKVSSLRPNFAFIKIMQELQSENGLEQRLCMIIDKQVNIEVASIEARMNKMEAEKKEEKAQSEKEKAKMEQDRAKAEQDRAKAEQTLQSMTKTMESVKSQQTFLTFLVGGAVVTWVVKLLR